MKKLLTLFAMLTLFVSMMAQTTPLNYQAVLRDPANNELVRNQAGTYQIIVVQNADPMEVPGGEFQTNADGMVNLPLQLSNEHGIEWMYVDTIKVIFTYGNKEIEIVTPVTPVPYAFHTDGSYLTTDHIVDYITRENIDGSQINGDDIDTIYRALKRNAQLHDGMRDSIVNYIMKNYEKAKEIGYHYLFLITATDLNQFYQEGRTIDQEVKDSIYSMAKQFLKENRDMLVELAKYYAETATAAEVNQLYNELLSNSTANAKIRELLYGYFDAYLVRKGLDGCNLCAIFNSFDPDVTPPAVPASVELLGHGITSSVLYGYLRVGNTTLDQGDVTLQADGSNHIFIPTLEAANLANGSAITYHHYRFTIPYSELAQQIGEQNLAHGLSLRCTLKIKHGEDLDKTIESPFDIDIDCPSPVVTDGQFELTLENAYVGEFTYTGGSSNVTVTGKYMDNNGEHLFTEQGPTLTLNTNTKTVSVVIPVNSVELPVGSQLYVTVTLKDINCEDTTVWASYIEGQNICPTVGNLSVELVEEDMLALSTNVDDYDASKVDYVRYVVTYGEGTGIQTAYITNFEYNNSAFTADFDLNDEDLFPDLDNHDTTFSIYFELVGKGDCNGEFYSDTVTYIPWHCGLPIQIGDEEYGTAKYGNVCWMTENMRNVPEGATLITDGSFNSNHIWVVASVSADQPMYYYPSNDTNNVSHYGLLYNWPAATAGEAINQTTASIQGICPDGWRLPIAGNPGEDNNLDVVYGNTAFDEFFENSDKKAGWIVPASKAMISVGNVLSMWSVGYYQGYWQTVVTSNVIDNKYDFTKKAGKMGGYTVRCVKDMQQ